MGGQSKGGLAFLNKKSWHTSTLKNQEKVWIAEQKREQEERQREQLRKELKEERYKLSLQQVQENAGLRSRATTAGVDWMYQTPASVNTKDEYLMGKQADTIKSNIDDDDNKHGTASAVDKKEEARQQPSAVIPGSRFETKQSTAISALERAALVRDDPLTAIMKEEQARRMAVLNNPIIMKQLKKEVSKQSESSTPTSSASSSLPSSSSSSSKNNDLLEQIKREQKKLKEERKKHRHRGSDDDKGVEDGKLKKERDIERDRDRDRKRRRDTERYSKKRRRERESESESDDFSSEDDYDRRYNRRHTDRHGHGHEPDTSWHGRSGRSSRDSDTSRSRRRSRSPRHRRSDNYDDRYGYAPGKSTSGRPWSTEERRWHQDNRELDYRRRNKQENGNAEHVSTSTPPTAPTVPLPSSAPAISTSTSTSSREPSKKFGLQRTNNALKHTSFQHPNSSLSASASVSRSSSRSTETKGNHHHDADDPLSNRRNTGTDTLNEKSRPMNDWQPSRPGALTDEEKERRLTEMMRNAQEHELAAKQRIADEMKRQGNGTHFHHLNESKPAFLHHLNKSVGRETLTQRMEQSRNSRQKGDVERHGFL